MSAKIIPGTYSSGYLFASKFSVAVISSTGVIAGTGLSAQATVGVFNGGGVLTVSDGAQSAKIKLTGNDLGDTFIAPSDGHGGVDIEASVGSDGSTRGCAAAMAGSGALTQVTGGSRGARARDLVPDRASRLNRVTAAASAKMRMRARRCTFRAVTWGPISRFLGGRTGRAISRHAGHSPWMNNAFEPSGRVIRGIAAVLAATRAMLTCCAIGLAMTSLAASKIASAAANMHHGCCTRGALRRCPSRSARS